MQAPTNKQKYMYTYKLESDGVGTSLTYLFSGSRLFEMATSMLEILSVKSSEINTLFMILTPTIILTGRAVFQD